ncbi:hypothetical protein P7K49_028593 [Saguinus oedipus]|uniref:Uncharacterized protein n=1 Tax=Saguinus oedipus TaxID=9490 RepID=A0ABQ9U5M2_SAGOE|nr:hypothetical protein P7K49_028593 [Saguinus oedipus]
MLPHHWGGYQVPSSLSSSTGTRSPGAAGLSSRDSSVLDGTDSQTGNDEEAFDFFEQQDQVADEGLPIQGLKDEDAEESLEEEEVLDPLGIMRLVSCCLKGPFGVFQAFGNDSPLSWNLRKALSIPGCPPCRGLGHEALPGLVCLGELALCMPSVVSVSLGLRLGCGAPGELQQKQAWEPGSRSTWAHQVPCSGPSWPSVTGLVLQWGERPRGRGSQRTRESYYTIRERLKIEKPSPRPVPTSPLSPSAGALVSPCPSTIHKTVGTGLVPFQTLHLHSVVCRSIAIAAPCRPLVHVLGPSRSIAALPPPSSAGFSTRCAGSGISKPLLVDIVEDPFQALGPEDSQLFVGQAGSCMNERTCLGGWACQTPSKWEWHLEPRAVASVGTGVESDRSATITVCRPQGAEDRGVRKTLPLTLCSPAPPAGGIPCCAILGFVWGL